MPFAKRYLVGLMLAVLVAVASGCEEPEIEYREVKRIDERVREGELQTYLRVLDALPDGRVPDLPPAFAPPPDWSSDRTLPVDELVEEEQERLSERWDVDWQTRHLKRRPALKQVLREERMTPQQFVGMTLAIGAAMSRSTLHEDQDLEAMLARGKKVVDALRRDERTFATLSLEEQHDVVHRAWWLTRVDRAERLGRVPPENVDLVRRNWGELAKRFPADYTTNPLDEIADWLEEYGVPFEELPESGDDGAIEWSRANAIVGHDEPDAAFRETPSARVDTRPMESVVPR